MWLVKYYYLPFYVVSCNKKYEPVNLLFLNIKCVHFAKSSIFGMYSNLLCASDRYFNDIKLVNKMVVRIFLSTINFFNLRCSVKDVTSVNSFSEISNLITDH